MLERVASFYEDEVDRSVANLMSLLEPLLSDSVWWVRDRTAQALRVLPGMGAQALLQIKERLADAYGRDIIDHVLSEHRLGITS